MAQRLFRVHGKVQGVGFRWWARSIANELGVTGSVRNLPDGSVEVRAQGSEELLGQLRAELQKGPPVAAVTRIDEEPATDVSNAGFDILH